MQTTRFLLSVLLICLVLILPQGFDSTRVHAAVSVNSTPDVVPSVQEWVGGTGDFQLVEASKIVVDSNDEQLLMETAELLTEELKAITGRECIITVGDVSQAGDIRLSLQEAGPTLEDEGYEMVISDSVTIKGNSSAGVFYGTRTLLQLLQQKDGVPKGTIFDYPRVKERGLMLDVGRHYFSMEFIEDLIKRMAWHKMNTLHMHLTEWNAFRLQSDQNPGLAHEDSYSKEDIRTMQDIANKYHVMIVPEIDLPGHATAINRYKPELNFSCPSMRQSVWYSTDWTINITKDVTRQWVKDLLDEFLPLFDGPYFHIGTDEYQMDNLKNACPELVDYARQRGFEFTGDVFVDWVNEVNEHVKSHGKTLQMWNWWDHGGQKYSIMPDRDIIINAWLVDNPSWYFDQGYDVVSIPGGQTQTMLYVTPGLNLAPNLKKIYEDWNPINHAQLRGYRMAVWADRMETQPDSFFEEKSGKTRQVLADRLWGGPRLSALPQFFERVALVGDAPGVSTPLPVDPLGSITIENVDVGTELNQVAYSGAGWGHGNDSYSRNTGEYYEIKFYGSQIKLWGAKDPRHGIAGISIDGGSETEVDLYAATRTNQYFYTSPILPVGEHTLKVRVTGKKNASATDHFVVLDQAEVTNRIVVRNEDVGTGEHQIQYTGNWTVRTDSYSNVADDYFEMEFNGRQVILVGAKAPGHGIVAVSINGGSEQLVDLYESTRRNDVLYYVSPVLGAGKHTVKVRVTGLKNEQATNSFGVLERIEVVPHESDVTEKTSVVLTGSEEVLSGQEFEIGFSLQHMKHPIQAQDITIEYDHEKLAFVSAESRLTDVEIVTIDDRVPGKIRFLAASLGTDNAIATEDVLFGLTWRAIEVLQPSSATIEVTKVILSDADGFEEEAVPTSLVMTITVTQADPADLNGDGKISIGDLAIAASHYGKDTHSPDWDEAKVADLNGDGKIDIEDLVIFASKIETHRK